MSEKGMTTVVALVTGLLLSACGGTDVSGSWQGADDKTGEALNLSLSENDGDVLSLSESDGDVTGAGEATMADVLVELTVVGATKDEHVSLSLSSNGLAIATYRGTVIDDRIDGHMRSARGEFQIDLTRR